MNSSRHSRSKVRYCLPGIGDRSSSATLVGVVAIADYALDRLCSFPEFRCSFADTKLTRNSLFPPLVTKLLSRATGVNMTNDERIREVLAGPITGDVLAQRAALGWVPYAIEWRRATAQLAAAPKREQVPFGMRVSSDCHFLEENPEEVVGLVAL